MGRYIDADALREKMFHEAFEKDSQDQKWDSGCWIRYHMFENVVDSIPTADVVPKEDVINELTKDISDRIIQALEANYEIIPKKPVVRCKDCKYLVGSEGVCKVLSNNYEPPVYVGDDDFCSHGERREDG